jgi:hypothetical protein
MRVVSRCRSMSAANANAARTACRFESVHRLTLAARQWAAKSPVTAEMTNKIIRDREKIQVAFDQLVERLNAFMMLTMWRIQDLRLHYHCLRPRAPTPCGNVDTPAPPPAGSTPPTGNDTMNKERTTAASPTVPLEKTPAAGLQRRPKAVPS